MDAPPHEVGGRRPTLPLRQPVQGGVPAVGSEASGIVEWHPGVVSQLPAGPALLLVLVLPDGPLPGKIDLSKCPDADECRHQQEKDAEKPGPTGVAHGTLR